jgi:quercetin 2,3-dioxygenase
LENTRNMKVSKIRSISPLGFQWQTNNPFLFCVHHDDKYPRGNGEYGPDPALLSGRSIGNDFVPKDGWRMYHGEKVPGFPVHPHRGFETITIVLKGMADHADSLGAAGRYGGGDVQWMTAGEGIQHSEMFPLLNTEGENTLELFQIWLNLPAKDKFAKPHYKMFWSEDIPKVNLEDGSGRKIEITVIAGEVKGVEAISPPPESWAADKDHEVAVLLIKMEAGAMYELPSASDEADRSLFYYRGNEVFIEDQKIATSNAINLEPGASVVIQNGEDESYFLMLQGQAIQEPVAQYGPFVMNTQDEIQQTINDYRKTQFGGWPWDGPDPVHGEKGRFAKYGDGREEVKSKK